MSEVHAGGRLSKESTLLNWEHRWHGGTARALLRFTESHPHAVLEALQR